MRKAIADASLLTDPFTTAVLEKLKQEGFKYVQVKGITTDNHYDYTEPSRILLIPLRELPRSKAQKDVYEPIESQLLEDWALRSDVGAAVVVARE